MESGQFSNRVQDVIRLSREEALRLGHDYIGTEHLLLGIIREGEGIAVKILRNLGGDLFKIKKAIEDTVRATGGTLTIADESGPVGLLFGPTAEGHEVDRDSRRIVVAAVGVAGAMTIGLIGTTQVADRARGARVAEEDVEALRGLGLPPGATVLTDGYSEGVIHGVTRAHGLLEGRAPYTFPDVLLRANTLLREAAEFYQRPRANRAFLDENDVDYVVVQRRRALTGPYRFRAPYVIAKLSQGTAFTRVAETPRLVIFRYDRPDEGDQG